MVCITYKEIENKQDRNLPHFGYSEQVELTYFYMKLSVYTCGIVDHSRKLDFVYLYDKFCAGNMNTNHTLNTITR